ncbi:uncharacterized protein LOC132945423 isoform X2 [Metopolophium dirhodum]|uniref:uncharacterized protein LOC132945423 isoform X2 n=1 Tax=Metopolophium dirhodum TaxID=44670 RepID=UPI00298FF6A2|nr:uncharacterized protein LOC132945423 isoform X2 [Metopolophium dirhodum]
MEHTAVPLLWLCLVSTWIESSASYPIGDLNSSTVLWSSYNTWLEASIVAVIFTICVVVFMVGCLDCCRNSRFSFKEFQNEVLSTRDYSSPGLAFVNPISNLHSNELSRSDSTVINIEQLSPSIKYQSLFKEWINDSLSNFPRSRLQFHHELGSGWFGRVVSGEVVGLNQGENNKVVVRILRDDATDSERLKFLQEAAPHKIKVKNGNHLVLGLVAACIKMDPLLLIFESSPCGDLKMWLRNNADTNEYETQLERKLKMSVQVVNGLLQYLKSGAVHTDVAARNFLVFPDNVVKIGDYGISTQTYKEDYYFTEEGVAIPIRWSSPETLNVSESVIETKKVTVEGNVWSAAVVIWEIMENGAQPYGSLSDLAVLSAVFIERTPLLLPPSSKHHKLSQQIYQVMLRCWNSDLSKRPTFPEIISSLEETYSMLKANFDPISSNSSPMFSKDFVRSDSDSGIMSSVNRPKSCEVQIYADDMSDISSQPSASSGVDVFNQSKKSPSLEILHGSLEDLTTSNDPWIRTDDSIQFMEGINNAIRELDEALAGEPTSSDAECSPPIVNFRLGPIAGNKISRPLFENSYNDNSYLERRSGNESSGTDTEDEHWRLRIERGEFSEKVKQKSKSVADLMVLTHIDASESSEGDTPLNSLSRQNSFKNNRLAVPLLNSLTFTSDSDLRNAQDDHDFQDTLKKFQTALKNRDDDSLSYLSLQIDNSMKVKKDTKTNNNTNPFLEIEASEKNIKNNPFILPNTTQCSTAANNSSVLLGPCENFTIDYYKGITSSLTEKPINEKLDNSIFENVSFTFNPYESMKWDSNIFDFSKPVLEESEDTKVECKSKHLVLDEAVKESTYSTLESDSGHTSDYTNCEDISTKDTLETKSLSTPNYTFNESSEAYNYYNNITVLKNGSDDSGCEIEQITSEDGSTEFLNDKSEDEDDNEITVIKVHDLYEDKIHNDQSKFEGISDDDNKQCESKGQYEIDDIIEGLSESWYLHPPYQKTSGWLPDTLNHDDETDDKELSLDEEYAEAIRQELRGKVNQNDNDSRNLNISLEENENVAENTDHTDMVIHYNVYPPPLSTIFEEDEDEEPEIVDNFSENPSPSCILTDTSTDHLVISREKLVDSSSELDDNVQDDVLIIDTITNEAIILDTDVSEKQEINVLNNTYTIEEVNSDTDDILENLESDSVASYSPDSLSPGSTSKTAAAVSYSSSESAGISDQFVSPTLSNNDLPLDKQTNAIKSIEELLSSPHHTNSNEDLDEFNNMQNVNWLKMFLNSETFCENDLAHCTSLPNSINFNSYNWPTVNELTAISSSEPNLTKIDVDKTLKTQAVYEADCWKSLDSNSTITEEKTHREFKVSLVNETPEKQESRKLLPIPSPDDNVLNNWKTVFGSSNDKGETGDGNESAKSEDVTDDDDEVEFVPSTWNSNAIPSKTSLRNSNCQSGAKKSVSFKQQNYHCVYEYPRDDSETFDLDIGPIWDRTPNYFDLSSFSDWGAGSSKTDLLSPSFIDDEACNPIQTFPQETNFNFPSTTFDDDFYISSSNQPFEINQSQFFPGQKSNNPTDDTFEPNAADLTPLKPKNIIVNSNEDVPEPVSIVNAVTLDEELAKAEMDNMDIKTLGKILSFKMDDVVNISDIKKPKEPLSPTLGELCHTKQHLTLNLCKSTSIPPSSISTEKFNT